MEKLQSSRKVFYLSIFYTLNVTDIGSMFANCSSLVGLNLSNLNLSNATDMVSMFWGCSSFTYLDMRNVDFSRVTSVTGMFDGSISSNITIIVKDTTAQTIIQNALTEYGVIGTVVIA